MIRDMKSIMITAVLASLPICVLLTGAAVLFSRERTVASSAQLLGAGCFMVVVAAHFAEALQWLPSMRWGAPHSLGHYLDLSGAVLGATLFPLGYLFHALRGEPTSSRDLRNLCRRRFDAPTRDRPS